MPPAQPKISKLDKIYLVNPFLYEVRMVKKTTHYENIQFMGVGTKNGMDKIIYIEYDPELMAYKVTHDKLDTATSLFLKKHFEYTGSFYRLDNLNKRIKIVNIHNKLIYNPKYIR